MSASTQTRRLPTPSSAKVVTRAIIRPQNAACEVVEPDELVARVDEDADRVEAQLGVPRAVGHLGEPGRGHPAHLARA